MIALLFVIMMLLGNSLLGTSILGASLYELSIDTLLLIELSTMIFIALLEIGLMIGAVKICHVPKGKSLYKNYFILQGLLFPIFIGSLLFLELFGLRNDSMMYFGEGVAACAIPILLKFLFKLNIEKIVPITILFLLFDGLFFLVLRFFFF